MITLSAITGFTFPGMIDEPGCTAGSFSSPIPQRGPDPRWRMSSATLIKRSRRSPRVPRP